MQRRTSLSTRGSRFRIAALGPDKRRLSVHREGDSNRVEQLWATVAHDVGMKMVVTSNGEHQTKVGVDVQPDSVSSIPSLEREKKGVRAGGEWMSAATRNAGTQGPDRPDGTSGARARVFGAERDAKLAELAARNYVTARCAGVVRVCIGNESCQGPFARACVCPPTLLPTHPACNWLAHLAATIERARHTASYPLALWADFCAWAVTNRWCGSQYNLPARRESFRGVSDAPVKSRSRRAGKAPRARGIEHVRPQI